MQSKLSILKDHAASGDWHAAIKLAAKFPQLGAERNAILDGNMALTRPDFCRQLKKDPDAMVEAAITALQVRYSI